MKKILLVLICLLLISSSAFAAPAADVNSELRTVTVSGTSETINGLVSVIVIAPTKGEGDTVNPPKDMKDLTYQTLVPNSAMIYELETDSEGKYVGDFKLSGTSPSGRYFVYVSGEEPFYFYYANATEVNDCISAINGSSKDAMGETLYKYTVSKEILGLDLEGDYAKYTKSANDIMYDFKEESKPDGILKIKALFEEALEGARILEGDKTVVCKALESNKLKNEFDSELDTEEISELLVTILKNETKPQSGYREFISQNLRKACALVAINSSTRGALTEVLEEYNDVLELDLDGDYDKIEKNAVNKKLVDKDFTSISAVQKAFKDAVKNASASEGSSSSGGGGGGGGGSSYTKVEFTPGYVAPQTPVTPAAAFTDLDSAKWAESYINSLAAQGIVSGVGNGKFEPQRSVTREEFLKMLISAFNITPTHSASGFDDVNPESWYAPYVLWATENGIVNGVGNNMFGTGSNITREQMAVMTVKMMEYSGKALGNASDLGFTDQASISSWAKDSVAKLVTAGIISGMPDNSFAPSDSLTRAQAAKVIYTVKAGV